MDEILTQRALDYHRFPTPGKISILPTKALTNQADLALAYSPGVAAACTAIERDPLEAHSLTSRGNLVAVITNGTAVLGLGAIGPLAGKPVMEGKACLFKKFAGIDVFDIEIAETNTDKLVDIIASLEPTFGGINLEDIKAPECFEIERRLRERMRIPVFHDDQHGTAIIVGAAVLNGLKVVGKRLDEIKLVCNGAGASAIACLDHLVALGLRRERTFVADTAGVIYRGRAERMEPNKERYAQETNARWLGEIIADADIFLGLSVGGALQPEMVAAMGPQPLILALANPEPEIRPEAAKAVRPDCIIATGRSDYPNQVNNVLGFPFVFRGALDVGATTINEKMKLAATHAIAELAQAEGSDVVALAYGTRDRFGPEYLIPRPFDPRLITTIAPAVAAAAMESGVATRPLADLRAYREGLARFVYHSGTVMQPVFAAAAAIEPSCRIVFAEGEDERVLRAAQIAVDEKIARPVLVGDAAVIVAQLREHGLRLDPGRDIEIVKPDGRDPTLTAAELVRDGVADGMLCGTAGVYADHLKHVGAAIGLRDGAARFAAMNLLMLPRHTVFVCDTYVNFDPSAVELAEMALLAADQVRGFGLTPRLALLSHSSFGSAETSSALKMREACALIRERAPALEVAGEMQGDAALSKRVLEGYPQAGLTDEANLLIMPNLDAANIAFNCLMTVAGEGVTIGPILLGARRPAHILTPVSNVRRIVNMTALTAVEARRRN